MRAPTAVRITDPDELLTTAHVVRIPLAVEAARAADVVVKVAPRGEVRAAG